MNRGPPFVANALDILGDAVALRLEVPPPTPSNRQQEPVPAPAPIISVPAVMLPPREEVPEPPVHRNADGSARIPAFAGSLFKHLPSGGTRAYNKDPAYSSTGAEILKAFCELSEAEKETHAWLVQTQHTTPSEHRMHYYIYRSGQAHAPVPLAIKRAIDGAPKTASIKLNQSGGGPAVITSGVERAFTRGRTRAPCTRNTPRSPCSPPPSRLCAQGTRTGRCERSRVRRRRRRATWSLW